MKFEMYGVEFKLELLVTSESTEIIILDYIENVRVEGGSIYHASILTFDLAGYIEEKVHEYVFKDNTNKENE